MSDQAPWLPWMEPAWIEQASAWVHAALDRRGISATGPVAQPHVRPWSTVLRVPTSAGDVYFKASAPVLAHEPGLTRALARWRPDCMPEVLAADVARGWLLMSDAGTMLRGVIRSVRDIWHWHRVLPLYAEVQIALADRLQQLLALGALHRRLATLPAQYDRLLTDTGALRIGLVDGLTSDEYRLLGDLRPRLAGMCAALAGYGIPETLHHDDFHDGNILVRDGRYTFLDWGESCAAHPFFTLVVTLRSIGHRLGLAGDAPELAQLRDAYLEPWTRYGSWEHLLAACALAQRLGLVCRALTWYRVVSELEGSLKAQYADAVPGWLRSFLEAETNTPP